ncbi:MAG: hypothetical protein ABWZ76_03040 [Acidimicrobiales bacterium]
MATEPYRVVQWATGGVGQAAIRHVVDNPVFELVGVLVTDPDKVGRDAGELAGTAPTGVIATDDVDAMVALDADCVHYAPLTADLDVICRLLRSGKNVVSPVCYVYPTEFYAAEVEMVEAACTEGGTSFHGTGIHPGFAGDILPLTFARLMNRIDKMHVYEIVDFSNDSSNWCEALGFGREPADALANPSRSDAVVQAFAQSMAMLVEGLGKKIGKITTEFEVATAKRDLNVASGIIGEGTVGGMHFEWTVWTDDRPLLVFHQYWTMGSDIEPNWDAGSNKYRLVFEGDPPLQVTFEASEVHPSGDMGFWGRVWTAMNGVNAIPQVCDARPGLVTHLDLGVVRPRGLVRPG